MITELWFSPIFPWFLILITSFPVNWKAYGIYFLEMIYRRAKTMKLSPELGWRQQTHSTMIWFTDGIDRAVTNQQQIV